ncbi:MAG: permease prefix domain 1-containing protein [Candidatus Krumholzibacteria bacterium]|nr:permease prefix domain 1-containing protein [Candidatus Krumholzibacteria bacterium]
MTNNELLEGRIEEWRQHLLKRRAIRSADVEELEDHLRAQVEALRESGLDEDEAFLVGVKRLGDLDSVSSEFAREYSGRLWKQLVVSPGDGGSSFAARRDTAAAVGLAIAAAAALKIPELSGLRILGRDADAPFYAINLSLFVLPFLACFFALKRGLPRNGWLLLALPFIAAALIANLPPFEPEGHTLVLTAIHLPVALWLATGFAYAGGLWRSHERRMNFVRFSGEWFIYYTLIALGGGILAAFAIFIFEAIGLDAEPLIVRWIIPCGAAGTVVIGAWLVENKQSVIENMAPVLTMLFTPLFAALLLVFVAAMVWTGNAIDVGREVLIGFDLLLVLVLGLLLYAISARDSQDPPGRFDRLRLLLVLCALLVDLLALWAMVRRTTEFGFSPNKTAALGLNLLLLVNLGWSAVLYARFLAKRAPFERLERWQTAYLPAYAVWAWIVAALFPVIFGYR